MKTILIADDEAGLRALVAATLEADRYEVLEAEDGHEAWALIRARRPALVVMDVMMPGRNGLELTRAIRADPSLDATKVVIVSARANTTDIRAGMQAGADR